MLSINTNLPSLTAQRSLTNSTKLLNQAIERMSTGFKINHASDNAANYSISTNMTTKLGSYEVAEDNVASGMDLLATAEGSLDLISDKLTRLRALAEQAANGTYGKQSIAAMNSEAAALINEIYRTKNTTEFNGNSVYRKDLLNEDTIGAQGLEVNSNGFLLDIERRDTSAMASLAEVDETQTLAQGTYSICSAEELAKLAKMQNAGKITAGSEFVLGADIDLSAYSSGDGWVPIGGNLGYSNKFSSIFDGNGYTIKNLYINRPDKSCMGLIGSADNAEIKNVRVENGQIKGNLNSGGIVGWSNDTVITNCVSGVDVEAWQAGGIVGQCGGLIDHCYTTGNMHGRKMGGLIGSTWGTITNCFATGNVYATEDGCGGLIGQVSNGSVDNCFATGDVYADNLQNGVGGLIGWVAGTVTNCHATGNITGMCRAANGGLIGSVEGTVENCYATVDVKIKGSIVGGLIGATQNNSTAVISNCFATGNVEIDGSYTGGLIGYLYSNNDNILNCYSTGNVTAKNYVGGLVGYTSRACTISESYSSGVVSATTGNYSGGIIGYSSNASLIISDCFVSGTSENVKGVFGGLLNSKVINCQYNPYYESSGIALKGSGSATFENCKAYREAVPFSYNKNFISLQCGINSSSSSRITVESSFSLGGLKQILATGINAEGNIELLDSLINKVSETQTEYGAAQNRLESALEEISTQYDNLVSSRSTLRDADVAEVSSEYIRQQILQQASATLLATANQRPALALQLL